MNLVINLEQYDPSNVYFSESIKNMVMNDSNFIKAYYSTQKFVLNGIYLYVPLMIHQNQLNLYFFNPILENKLLIEKIREIEDSILERVGIMNKECEHCLYEKISTGRIKVHSKFYESVFNKIIIKISGVWENEYSYGLNFKIYV